MKTLNAWTHSQTITWVRSAAEAQQVQQKPCLRIRCSRSHAEAMQKSCRRHAQLLHLHQCHSIAVPMLALLTTQQVQWQPRNSRCRLCASAHSTGSLRTPKRRSTFQETAVVQSYRCLNLGAMQSVQDCITEGALSGLTYTAKPLCQCKAMLLHMSLSRLRLMMMLFVHW